MGWFMPTFFTVIGIVATVVIVIVRIKGGQALAKIDIQDNAPIIELGSRSMFTNGYGRGILKSQMKCKNGCTRIEFFPLDYEQGENKKQPPPQAVIVKNEYIKYLAQGEGDSSYRQIIKLVDNIKTNIPEKLWGTDIEKDMSVEGQKGYLKSLAGQMAGETHKAVMEHISENTYVGMNKITLAQLKEKVNAMTMTPVQTQETEKK